MSVHLDPRLILEYLNELGYTGITPQQLKEFMRDLKRLIKYEETDRNLYENQENTNYLQHCLQAHTHRTRPNGERTHTDRNHTYSERTNTQTTHQPPNVFETLHATCTTSSKAKSVPKKESIISVQIHRPMQARKPQPDNQTQDNSEYDKIEGRERSDGGEGEGRKSREDQYLNVTNQEPSFPDSDTISPFNITKSDAVSEAKSKAKTCTTSKTRSDCDNRPKSSFIRPKLPPKPCKSDPVALYHYYQKEWKKAKIPGEDNRSALRWVVRENMLGQNSRSCSAPPCESRLRRGTHH